MDKVFNVLNETDRERFSSRRDFLDLVTKFNSHQSGFFGAISLLAKSLINADVVKKLVYDVIKRASEQQVKILELSVSPKCFVGEKQGEIYPYMDAFFQGVAAAREDFDIAVGVIALIRPKHMDPEFELKFGRIEEYLTHYREQICGIDICSFDEVLGVQFTADQVIRIVGLAGDLGLSLSAHAGEFNSSEPMWQAIEVGARRIGHGIRCVDDPKLIKVLKEKGIYLEVCPISNYRTGALQSCECHPIRSLLDAEVKVTINADDPAVQNSGFRSDFDFALGPLGLNSSQIGQCLQNAFEASFVAEKQRYRSLFYC